MFKYSPRKDIRARFLKLKRSSFQSWWNYVDEVAREFAYGNQYERYAIKNVIAKEYQLMPAFYSEKPMRFIPCGGLLLPVAAFDEEKVDA